MSEIKIVSNLHKSTKRNYLKRMKDSKIKCMTIAKKYGFDYWDGNRKYGYGGYKYIPGRWTPIAKKLIKIYKLNNNSSILDIGCGKAYLLYEIKKILPKIKIKGLDISAYGINKSLPLVKKFLRKHDIKKGLPFKKNSFDLAISLACLHNLEINHLMKSIKKINNIAKKKYIMVESYRNNKELFNLQCWALTCESFFSKNEWKWLFKNNGYNGDYEFIYFE
jgi:SAM-dependent methyltransferase